MARSNINICFFSGNLTRDPEVNISAAGNAYARFTIASNDEVYDVATTSYSTIVNFIDCIAFGDLAERLKTFYRKGNRISVEAKLVQHVMYDEKCNRNRRYNIYRVIAIDGDESSPNNPSDIPDRNSWSSSMWN